MKTRLSMRTALVFGLPAVARNIGPARWWCRGLLERAGHEAGKGNVVTAVGLMVMWAMGL